VKAPGFGDRRKAMLEDIAVLTGGKAITEDLGIKLENLQLGDLGRAKKVVVDKDNTTLVEGAGKPSAIEGRINRSERRSTRRPRTTTARNCRSGWRSWRRRGGDQGRRGDRDGHEGEEGARSRTRSTPRARPSRKASSQAVALPSFGRPTPSTGSSWRATRRSAA
jgi:hypothetical protein